MPTAYLKKHGYALILILIVILAVFFRFWHFTSIPPGLYQDEAMNGANALQSLETGKFSVFYPDNNGREGMIVWLDALAVKLFGIDPWVLRIAPAVAGVLAVLGLYFLTKIVFNAETALAASFFMAVGFWAVNFSRIGFRANLMLPFLIWSFYFLYRAVNPTSDVKNPRHRMSDFAAAGVLFGLGFYTYLPFRFAPLLLILAFGPLFIRRFSKKLAAGVLIFSLVAIAVFLPLGFYFAKNPADFFGRAAQLSVFAGPAPFKDLFLSSIKTLGMFNVFGDFNWRHNFAGRPELFWPVGLLFLIGLWQSVKRFKFGEKFWLAWLFIFLIPAVLSGEGLPHALRSLAAAPAAYVFSAVGFIWLYKILGKGGKPLILALFLAFSFFIAGSEFGKYFINWSSNTKVAEAFSKEQAAAADYLNRAPAGTKKYVLFNPGDALTSNGLPVSAQTVFFLTNGKSGKSQINYLRTDETDKIELGATGTIIVPIYFDTDLLHNLQKKYLKSRIEIVGLNIGAVIVP